MSYRRLGRNSMRLSTWDYGRNAAYFITICTAEREHFFGEVIEGEMQLSPAGYLAARYWKEIPEHFPFITLDAFVVMHSMPGQTMCMVS